MVKRNYVFVKRDTKIITLSILILVIGFFLGVSSANSNVNDLEVDLENTLLDLKSFSNYILFQESVGDNICSDFDTNFLLGKIRTLAVDLVDLEEEGSFDSDFYDLLKEKYNINQVLFYTYYKNYYEACSDATPMVLFFFDSENNDLGVEQGEILDKIREDRDIIVLPVDYGKFDNLEFFYDFYEVDEVPHLVINYNYELSGLSDAASIEYGLDLE